MKSNNPKAVRQAMTDLLLISMADEAILSGWSTFGNVAVGMAEDLLPLLVTESTQQCTRFARLPVSFVLSCIACALCACLSCVLWSIFVV